MVAFGNHCTLKYPMGFRWFSPPGEMLPLLLGSKAGTAMVALGNHCTTEERFRQPAGKGERLSQPNCKENKL